MSNAEEQALKYIGMWTAASAKRESLEKARQYLIQLSLERPDGQVNADDANSFIEHADLPPLKNAAGSLFKNKKIWEQTGEWRPSERKGNHAHLNPQWRLRRGYDGVGDHPEPVSATKKKTLTPSQAKKELAALTDLYESSSADDMSEKMYEALKSDIYGRMQ
jgi:hypothetical protein